MRPRDDGSTRSGSAAELALQLAEEAELPVVLVDPGTQRIREVNRPFLQEFGLDQDQARGERIRDLVEGDAAWEIRDAVSVAAFGGSPEPVTAELDLHDLEAQEAVWQAVPNVLEGPTEPVALVCRPKGRTVGSPVDPPAFHESGSELDRIPPRDRVRDEKLMSETSRYLWD